MWARIGIGERELAAALGTFARTPGVVTDDLLGFHGGKISVKLFYNLEGVIERVGALRDAATSAFLLETKRERFSGTMFDYDL